MRTAKSYFSQALSFEGLQTGLKSILVYSGLRIEQAGGFSTLLSMPFRWFPAIPAYFSTPVITMPCMNTRWAMKKITTGRVTAITAAACSSPGWEP